MRIDETTLLYLRGDTYTDLSPYNNTITNSNTTIIDDSYKFVTGSNQYMYITDNNSRFAFGNNDFTIEFNISFDSFFTNLGIFTPMGDTTWVNRTGAWHLIAGSDKKIAFDYYSNTSTVVTLSSKELVVGKSYHFALSVKNSKAYMFIDGILCGTKDITVPLIGQSKILIGKHDGGNYICHNGIMSNIRISNVAKYTENFTPPSKPFTSVNLDIEILDEQMIVDIHKSDKEEVSKLDVLYKDKIIYTESDFSTLQKTIDVVTNTLSYGINNFYIRAYYYNDHYIEKNIKYIRNSDIEKINTSRPNVNTIMNKIVEICDYTNSLVDNLFDTLVENGYELSERDRKLTNLIHFIKGEGQTGLSLLHDILNAKNIPYSKDDDIKTLIQSLDDYLVYRKYYYNKGVELVSTHPFECVKIGNYSTGTLTKNETNILITQTTGQIANIILSNTIDLTPYTNIFVELKALSFQNSVDYYLPTLSVLTSKDDSAASPGFTRGKYTTDIQIIRVDVSNINTSYYIGVQCMGCTYEIYKLWFE